MEADPTKACNQDDATDLNGLRLKVAAKVHGKKQHLSSREDEISS